MAGRGAVSVLCAQVGLALLPRALGDSAFPVLSLMRCGCGLRPEVGEPEAPESPRPHPPPPALSQRLPSPFLFPFHFLRPLQLGSCIPPLPQLPQLLGHFGAPGPARKGAGTRPPSQEGAEPPPVAPGAWHGRAHVTDCFWSPWGQTPPCPFSQPGDRGLRRRVPWPPVCAIPVGMFANTLGRQAQELQNPAWPELEIAADPTPHGPTCPPASQASVWGTRGTWHLRDVLVAR